MFGLAYALFIGVGGTISGIKCACENADKKSEAEYKARIGKNPYRIYWDRKACMRYLDTDEMADVKIDDKTGDVWLCKGKYHCEKYRNFSKEWRDKFFKVQKNCRVPGRTVVPDITRPYNVIGEKWSDRKYYAAGQWYKDLSNGNLYVCRQWYGIDFYMDVRNGFLIRPTDSQEKDFIENKKKGYEVPTREEIEKIKNQFNGEEQAQKLRFKKEKEGDSFFWHDFYLNRNMAYDDLEFLHKVHKAMGPYHKIQYEG